VEVRDSVVMITGGARRVGKQVALYLAGRGAHIAFCDIQAQELEGTRAQIESCGVRSLAMAVDVTQSDQVRAFVDATIERFGRIDVLINNAAIWLHAPFLQIREEDWDRTMEVNLKGPFICSQLVAPHMLRQGRGLIINMTSLSAFQTWPGYAHDAASKAGLWSLTKSMAVELAPAVRVNAIAPGTILLPEDAPPEKRRWAEEKSLLKAIGSPLDVARLIEFLIECDFATGAVYFVDGGRSLT
jgi:NAD(P)-dependent dehydrogenase (short-subunit alcohol dehydrogenase family)